jgi:hypothetical protein
MATPSPRPIAQKLQLKAGRRVAFVNPPAGFHDVLGPLPPGVLVLDSWNEFADVILVFVENRAALERELPGLVPWVAPGGSLWVGYRKRASGEAGAVDRDSIAAYAATLGLKAVAVASLDDTWSAERLKTVV